MTPSELILIRTVSINIETPPIRVSLNIEIDKFYIIRRGIIKLIYFLFILTHTYSPNAPVNWTLSQTYVRFISDDFFCN